MVKITRSGFMYVFMCLLLMCGGVAMSGAKKLNAQAPAAQHCVRSIPVETVRGLRIAGEKYQHDMQVLSHYQRRIELSARRYDKDGYPHKLRAQFDSLEHDMQQARRKFLLAIHVLQTSPSWGKNVKCGPAPLQNLQKVLSEFPSLEMNVGARQGASIAQYQELYSLPRNIGAQSFDTKVHKLLTALDAFSVAYDG